MLAARSKIDDLCNLAFPLKIVNPLSAKRAKIDGACGPLIPLDVAKNPYSRCTLKGHPGMLNNIPEVNPRSILKIED